MSFPSSGGSTSPTYDTDAQAYFTKYAAVMGSELDTPHKTDINTLFTDIKALGSGACYAALEGGTAAVNADSAAALINLFKPSAALLTPINAPSFAADRGYQCNGSNGLDTNFVPNTGAKFLQNSAHIMCWNLANTGAGNGVLVGANDTAVAGGSEAAIYPNFAGSTYGRLNEAGTGAYGSIADTSGCWLLDRSASNVEQLFHDGTQFGATQTGASVTRGAISLALGARNSSSGISLGNSYRIGAASWGGSVATYQAGYYTAWQKYLHARGAI